MDRDEIIRRKAAIVAVHKGWSAYNIDLGHGVFTIGEDADSIAEARIARIVTVVRDAMRRPLADLSVLDLGAWEGGFSVALAREGAQVTAVEARESHVVKARLARDALGLDNLTVIQADVREFAAAEHGQFDVVLCLGILYHLDAPAVFEFVAELAALTSDCLIIEGQVALRGKRSEVFEGDRYEGLSYSEDISNPGASLDNPQSFWLTRASLLRLLGHVGFSSVAECLTPVIEELAVYEDHVTLLARRGEVPAGLSDAWPENLQKTAHPAQGLRHALSERLRGQRRLGRMFRG